MINDCAYGWSAANASTPQINATPNAIRNTPDVTAFIEGPPHGLAVTHRADPFHSGVRVGRAERPISFVLFPMPLPTACRSSGPPAESAGRPWPEGLFRPVRCSGSLPSRLFVQR